MTAKLGGPGGVRAVIAENLLLKQQLIVLLRARQRAPNLTLRDRLLCGFGSLFISPGRIRKVAIGARPSTLLAFHQALVRRKYHRLFASSRRSKRPGPRAPSEALIQAIVELKSVNPRVRLSPDCAHHLAQVRGRDRQERRVPCAIETLSCRPGGNRASWLSFIGHTTDGLWSADLCSTRVHRAPKLLGARSHGPVHASPRRSRRAPRSGQ